MSCQRAGRLLDFSTAITDLDDRENLELLEHVDTMLRVCPTVIGAGKSVFPSGQFSLELIEARPLATNGALLRYRPS